MERLTDPCWKNLDPWECCGQDYFCKRGCHEEGGCTNGCIVPKIYVRLASLEDTGVSPEKVSWMKEVVEAAFDNDTSRIERAHNLHVADKEGRVMVLPCKVGERWVDEGGRAVRITAVIVSIEPFGTSINIYFDYEDAMPDDAGSDCVTNWDYFSRHYTCIEAERAMEDKKDG